MTFDRVGSLSSRKQYVNSRIFTYGTDRIMNYQYLIQNIALL